LARQKLRVETFIEVSEDEVIPWYTVYEDGHVEWFLPEEEAEKYRNKMIENMGKRMSEYYSQEQT